MKDKRTTAQKKADLLKSLEKYKGLVMTACKDAGIPRNTYYYWYNKDKAFKEAADNTVESQIDIVEASLFKQISEGNTTAIIFFLKTKAKHRGYVERVEQDISSSQPMELNIKIIEGNGKD